MIKKLKFAILLILSLFYCAKKEKKFTPTPIETYDTVTYRIYRVDSGWGYDILINSKVFIHQPYIPAVQGKFVFLKAEDAKKTAIFVIKRLISRPGLPTITVQDLDSLGVLYDTVKRLQSYDFSVKNRN